MATIDFPDSPVVNDVFTVGAVTYKWTGVAWISNNVATFDWDDITGKPATFPPSAHTHPISDVTSLQTALDGKAASVHTHLLADITDYTPPVIPEVTFTNTFMLMGA